MRSTIGVAASAVFCACVLAGCAAAGISESGGSWTQLDAATQYKFFVEPDGFIASINYGHYQFFPEQSAAGGACRNVLLGVIERHVRESGREILPLDETQISMSFRRNGLTGTTSCAANVPVRWSAAPAKPNA